MKLLKRSPYFAVLVLLVAFGSLSVSAKDVWLNVRSQNFNLYGNASEKEIKRAATKLEQFRETFRQLFATVKLESSVPTNVIVFKSNSYYKEFKPKRADGKTDDFVAGFFQPGEDVNYITLSMDGRDEEIFKVIFHEYVHSILNAQFSRITIPPWFNEGLAEYYSTFQIRDDRVVSLGLPIAGHLQMLQRTDLMPLETLFSISGYGLLQMSDRPRSLFYAESWALVHYLIQSGKTDGLGSFLAALSNGSDAKNAFEKAFQMDYEQMEKELRKYARSGSFKYHTASFQKKLTFDESMVVTPIDEGEANAYLGDLLYHNNRAVDAEPYLTKALAIHPDSAVANMAMGMVRFRAGKYDDAGQFLDKVVTENSNSHFACYLYAVVLTKTASDGARSISEDAAKKAVGLVKRSIALNPKFFPSYDLLAFTALSTGVGRDDAVAAVSSGLKLRPNDPMLLLRLAELYARTGKVAEAGQLAAKAESLSDDPRIKSNAANVKQYAEAMARAEAMSNETSANVGIVSGSAEQPELSPEELKEQNETLPTIEINKQLTPLKNGMKRVVGYLGKISCPNGTVNYAVNSDSEKFTLTSKDFQGLELMVYGGNGAKEVGCDDDLSSSKAVLT
jgi:tetratricopeptide (TPR) repeat protein